MNTNSNSISINAADLLRDLPAVAAVEIQNHWGSHVFSGDPDGLINAVVDAARLYASRYSNGWAQALRGPDFFAAYEAEVERQVRELEAIEAAE